MICRIAVFKSIFRLGRPLKIFRRYFGSTIDSRAPMALHKFTQKLLAFAGAVSPGRIKEIAAKFNGTVERFPYFVQIGPCPSRHAPHPVSDFAYIPFGSSESSVLHGVKG